MYFNLRDCPYLRAESEPALIAMLADFNRLPQTAPAVLTFYGATESGRSAQNVAQWISDRIPE